MAFRHSGGFTEEDQERLAQDVLSHSLAKGSKTGLGFGGSSSAGGREDGKKTEEGGGSSSSRKGGDGDRHHKRDRSHDRRSRDRHHDDDNRARRERHRSDSRERRHEGKSRRARSRSRSRERSHRSRSRSEESRGRRRRRSRSAEDEERRRTRRKRSSSRSRSRDRRRDDHHRDRRRDNSDSNAIQSSSGVSGGNPSQVIASIGERIRARVEAAASKEEQTKAAVNDAAQRLREKLQQSLKQAERGDQGAARATGTNNHGWERPEMAAAGDFFSREEVNVTGSTEGTEAYVKRMELIAAIENEKVEGIGDMLEADRQQAISKKTSERNKELKRKRKEEEAAAKKAQKEKEWDLPLYKRLKIGDTVDAKYSADGQWYEATIKSVIHGGYPNAMFGVVYVDWGNEEEVSWKDCRLVESARAPSSSSSSEDEEEEEEEEDEEEVKGGAASAPSNGGGVGGIRGDVIDEEAPLVNPALLTKRVPPGSSWKDRVAAQQKNKHPPPASTAGSVSSALPLPPVTSALMSVTALTQELARQDAESQVAAYLQDTNRPKINLSLGGGLKKRK